MREEYIREKIKEAQEVIMEALEALELDQTDEEIRKFDQAHGTPNDKAIRESSNNFNNDQNRDISAI